MDPESLVYLERAVLCPVLYLLLVTILASRGACWFGCQTVSEKISPGKHWHLALVFGTSITLIAAIGYVLMTIALRDIPSLYGWEEVLIPLYFVLIITAFVVIGIRCARITLGIDPENLAAFVCGFTFGWIGFGFAYAWLFAWVLPPMPHY